MKFGVRDSAPSPRVYTYEAVGGIDYAYLLIDEVFNLNFKDVKETDWFYKAVKEAVFGGLMKGRSEETFDPTAPCTRAELAQFGVNLLKKIEEIQKIKEG